MTNITVLKDENLGGIEREYREVNRKARVGERIKIVAAEYDINGGTWGYDNGEVHTVISSDGNHEVNIRPDGTEDSEIYVESSEYVTLEQTDFIRINGERFRMVDRKAAGGERVIVVNPDFDADEHGDYTTGDTAIITSSNTDSYDVYYLAENSEGTEIAVYAKEYRVLEPVTSAEPAPLLSDKPSSDQAAELIAKLTTRVDSLEKRVAALETPKSRPATDEEVADVIAKLSRAKSPQEIRDDIVKRAKEDLEGVKTPWNVNRDPQPLVYTFRHYVVDVEFIVNQNKRTVVALARWRNDGSIVSKGIAKCAPGDVFNSHIGRAIALRRALGITVPAEYFEAPNPTEVRVGDVIDYGDGRGSLRVFPDNGDFISDTTYLSTAVDHIHRVVFIDDSRESDGAAPRKEVA
ncbi:hypothetical protein [Paenibacillus xylanilyticus]|uniref:hypothetical protein n=1 Tax=Paenibacillus xylanilyticus TaxID=248903 RepID=UPI003AAADD71